MSLAREKSSWRWTSGFHSYQTPAITTICWAENTSLFYTPSNRGTHWQIEEASQDLGESPETLRVRHLLARTLFATEISPFLPLVALYTWLRHIFSVGVSPHGNLEVLEDHSWPGVLTALVTARTPNPNCVLHGTTGSVEYGHQVAWVCPGHWWRRKREQRGEGSCNCALSRCWKGTFGFASYYICSLSFSSGVCGFFTCEQLWLLVPDNSVKFLLSEAP